MYEIHFEFYARNSELRSFKRSKQLPQIVNAAFIISAWSAAAVDLFLASRYLYFVSCLGQAPPVLGALYLRRISHEKADASPEPITNTPASRKSILDSEKITKPELPDSGTDGPELTAVNGGATTSGREAVYPFSGLLITVLVSLFAYTTTQSSAANAPRNVSHFLTHLTLYF